MFKTRKAEVEALRQAYHEVAKLVDIQRNGRVNVFTFIRNNETFVIETYGTLGDDVAGWRKSAGL